MHAAATPSCTQLNAAPGRLDVKVNVAVVAVVVVAGPEMIVVSGVPPDEYSTISWTGPFAPSLEVNL